MEVYLVKPREENRGNRFFTKKGLLTAYSFHCGYVETYQTKEQVPYHVFIASPPFDTMTAQIEIKIYKDSRVFFVQFSDYSENGENETFCFDSIKEAREKVAELKRKVKPW